MPIIGQLAILSFAVGGYTLGFVIRQRNDRRKIRFAEWVPGGVLLALPTGVGLYSLPNFHFLSGSVTLWVVSLVILFTEGYFVEDHLLRIAKLMKRGKLVSLIMRFLSHLIG